MNHNPSRISLPVTLSLVATAMAALLVMGCGDILPGRGPAPDLYVLSPKSSYPDDLPTVEAQLVIAEPSTGRTLNTDRIVLKPTREQIKYFAGVRWVTLAPKMIQTMLVESFENSGKIVAVGRQAVTLHSDYLLISELREFQAEYVPDRQIPDVVVTISARIIRQSEARIVDARTFRVVIPADDREMRAIVRAFDGALGKVLKRMVTWTLTTIAEAES